MNWQLSFFWNADNVHFFASRYIMGMVRYVVLYSLNVIYSYLIAAAAKSVIKPPQTSGKQLLVFSKKSWCGSALFVIVRFKILNTEWGDSTLQNILKLLMVLEFWMENGEILSCGEDAWSIQSLKQREELCSHCSGVKLRLNSEIIWFRIFFCPTFCLKTLSFCISHKDFPWKTVNY